MPTRLGAPVLTVDAAKMHKVDIRNVDNLHGMWTVFSKCAESLEEGRRLENLSWRLWNRETFCCEPDRRRSRALGLAPASAPYPSTTTRPSAPTREKPSDENPELSASVESAVSDGDDEDSTRGRSASADAPRHLIGPARTSSNTSRGLERHITSSDLEKMVSTIKERKPFEPLAVRPSSSAGESENRTIPAPQTEPGPALPPASTSGPASGSTTKATDITPRPSSPTVVSTAPSTAPRSTSDSLQTSPEAVGSDTSAGSNLSSHSIVRGFEPGQVCSSYRSQSRLAPAPAATRPPPVATSKSGDHKKKSTVFMLGGSSGEEESSLEEHMQPLQPLQPGRSSMSDHLKRTDSKKQTSFKDEVTTRTIDESAVDVFSDDDDAVEDDDDDDEDNVSESAIDDEDSDEWEDSVSESGRSSVEEQPPLFQRVDSKANLTSRRSLLTSLMHQDQRAAALANAASRSVPAMRQRSRTSSPNGPSLATSFEAPEGAEDNDDNGILSSDDSDADAGLHMRSRGDAGPHPIPHSKPIIMTTSNTHPPALSPRTTRRNMLATELTESLRRHLLWERQQKNATATAVLKRRHTSQDVSKLSAYPGQHPAEREGSKNNSWNVFDQSAEYNQTGW